ncbi:Sporulation kinase D [compost metagenome]
MVGLLHSVISHELHGLMYIMSALLIYLILTPTYVYKEHKRNVLFVLILLLLTSFYWGFENIDPVSYVLHLTPVSLCLAILFKGCIPGISTWLAFNIGSFVVLDNALLPTLLGSTAMLIVGLIFKNKIQNCNFPPKFIFSTVTMTVYLVLFYAADPTNVNLSTWVPFYTILGSFISTWLVTYLFFEVKKQEINKEKLYISDKDRLVGQLAASVSHEIRNPLTITRGFLQMMEQRNFTEDERKRFVGLALSGIDEANSIITDYLDFAKPITDQVDRVNINDELASTIRFISLIATSNHVEIELLHGSEEPIYMIGEAKKLRQCLINLIKNSIESMPKGGKITIETHKLDPYIQITIADTGVGMTKTQIKSLGIPFITTKAKGTGLGLVVVMSLIKTMNGKITFTSKINKGTLCQIQFKSH